MCSTTVCQQTGSSVSRKIQSQANEHDRAFDNNSTSGSNSYQQSTNHLSPLDARDLRVHHPLEESRVCEFVSSFVTVLLSLTVGIAITLITAAVCCVAHAIRCTWAFALGTQKSGARFEDGEVDCGRRRQVNPAAHGLFGALKRRWKMVSHLMSPHDAQWLPFPSRAMAETSSSANSRDWAVHHSVLLLKGRVSVSRLRRVLDERLLKQQTLTPGSMMRLFCRLVAVGSGSFDWFWSQPASATTTTDVSSNSTRSRSNHNKLIIRHHVVAGAPLDNLHQLSEYLSCRLNGQLQLFRADQCRNRGGVRPLWRVTVVPVARARDTAVVIHVHRSVADGMALLRLLCLALADRPPTRFTFGYKVNFGSITYTLSMLRAYFYAPIFFAQSVLSRCWGRQFHTRVAHPPSDTGLGCAGPVSFNLSLGRLSWRKLMAVKEASKHSLNEILLALIAGAMRAEMKGAGTQLPPSLPGTCTVDLRAADETARSLRLTNRSVEAPLALPCHIEGTVPRLWAARHQMTQLKQSPCTAVIRLVSSALYRLLPRHWAAAVLRATVAPPGAVVLANLAAPESALWLAGHRISGIYTCVTPPPGALVSVCALSYNCRMYVTVCCRRQLAGHVTGHVTGKVVTRRVQRQLSAELNQLYCSYKHRLVSRRATTLCQDSLITPDSHSTEQSTTEDQLRERLVQVHRELTSLMRDVTERELLADNRDDDDDDDDDDEDREVAAAAADVLRRQLDKRLRQLRSEMSLLAREAQLHRTAQRVAVGMTQQTGSYGRAASTLYRNHCSSEQC